MITFYIFGFLALLVVYLLISLVEMTVLQLLKWGDFRQAMKASLVMNAFSSLVNGFLLVIFQNPALWGLLVAWGLSLLVEGAVLHRLRPGTAVYNGLAVTLANTSSFLLVVLPAYLQR